MTSDNQVWIYSLARETLTRGRDVAIKVLPSLSRHFVSEGISQVPLQRRSALYRRTFGYDDDAAADVVAFPVILPIAVLVH